MRSKLNYLINVSLKRKIKTKWFLIANILLGLLIVGLFNIDSIIVAFGGDFNKVQPIYVIDNTNEVYDMFVSQVESTGTLLDAKGNFEIKPYENDVEKIKDFIKEDKDAPFVLVFNPSDENVLDVTLYSEGYIDAIDYQLLASSINSTKTALAIQKTNIDLEEMNKIYSNVEIKREYLSDDAKSEDENMEAIMTTVFPIVILPFFMLTIFLVQMIGAEVNDEKSTRGMEIIISNVSPKTHFFAKVIAGNLFVLIQGFLLLAFAGIGLLLRNILGGSSITGGVGSEIGSVVSKVLTTTGLADKLIYLIPLILVLMIITFIAYSLLAGILASMTTNIEDFQQLQTPIMIISLVGYYLAMMAGMFKGALFIRILSYVPLLSAILSPSLLVMGQIGIIDIVISILLTCGLNYLLVKYGLRIYKVGILNYSSKDLWKKMFKAIKQK